MQKAQEKKVENKDREKTENSIVSICAHTMVMRARVSLSTNVGRPLDACWHMLRFTIQSIVRYRSCFSFVCAFFPFKSTKRIDFSHRCFIMCCRLESTQITKKKKNVHSLLAMSLSTATYICILQNTSDTWPRMSCVRPILVDPKKVMPLPVIHVRCMYRTLYHLENQTDDRRHFPM